MTFAETLDLIDRRRWRCSHMIMLSLKLILVNAYYVHTSSKPCNYLALKLKPTVIMNNIILDDIHILIYNLYNQRFSLVVATTLARVLNAPKSVFLSKTASSIACQSVIVLTCFCSLLPALM